MVLCGPHMNEEKGILAWILKPGTKNSSPKSMASSPVTLEAEGEVWYGAGE